VQGNLHPLCTLSICRRRLDRWLNATPQISHLISVPSPLSLPLPVCACCVCLSSCSSVRNSRLQSLHLKSFDLSLSADRDVHKWQNVRNRVACRSNNVNEGREPKSWSKVKRKTYGQKARGDEDESCIRICWGIAHMQMVCVSHAQTQCAWLRWRPF
jgi:hypothetical protein